MSSQEPRSAPGEPPETSLGSVVARLAVVMQSGLSPGDLAALRRLRGDVPPAAFYRLVARHLEPESLPEVGAAREALEARWMIVLAAMARLVGLHRPRLSLGEALADAGYHELRFERLLRADSAALPEQIQAASIYLAARGAPCDHADLAALVLTTDPARATQLRRRLARSYHRTLSKKTRTA
ncbi:MAG: type I-E CRISPR-associated protein Cse2/CasB [Dehalococcoidia bacterium]|nr:type I-E CRISPR-associated protein Cse2/CasB [Dehalococcoidia bacterium]